MLPKRRWAMVALISLGGVLVGLGLFTFSYGEGLSYFSNDPESCMNCHIMRDQFDSWNHSSHKAVATCNDCHTPHNFAEKYFVKARNGFNHSFAFTFNTYPDNIQIKEFNADVVQQNCVDCHEDLVSLIYHDDDRSCVTCHGNVGHRRN